MEVTRQVPSENLFFLPVSFSDQSSRVRVKVVEFTPLGLLPPDLLVSCIASCYLGIRAWGLGFRVEGFGFRI